METQTPETEKTETAAEYVKLTGKTFYYKELLTPAGAKYLKDIGWIMTREGWEILNASWNASPPYREWRNYHVKAIPAKLGPVTLAKLADLSKPKVFVAP